MKVSLVPGDLSRREIEEVLDDEGFDIPKDLPPPYESARAILILHFDRKEVKYGHTNGSYDVDETIENPTMSEVKSIAHGVLPNSDSNDDFTRVEAKVTVNNIRPPK